MFPLIILYLYYVFVKNFICDSEIYSKYLCIEVNATGITCILALKLMQSASHVSLQNTKENYIHILLEEMSARVINDE